MNKIIIKTSLLTIFAAGVAYSSTSNPAYNSPGVQRAKDIQAFRLARYKASRESKLRTQKQIEDLEIEKAAEAKKFNEEKQQHNALKLTHAQTEKDLSAEKVKVLQGMIRGQLEKEIADIAEEALLKRHTVVNSAAPQDGDGVIFETIHTTFEQHKGYCTKRISEAEIESVLGDVKDNTDPSEYIKSKQTEITQVTEEYAERRVNDYDKQLAVELAELTEVQAGTVEDILKGYGESLSQSEEKPEVKEDTKKKAGSNTETESETEAETEAEAEAKEKADEKGDSLTADKVDDVLSN